MSLAVFPVPALTEEQQEQQKADNKTNHVPWLIDYIREDELKPIKHVLDECYALLAPVHPGTILVLSTRHNEKVKGTITRVGTRIVKANIHLQLHTQPHQTFAVDPNHPIHVSQLVTLNRYLNDAIKAIKTTLDNPPDPEFTKAQLRLLATLVSDSYAILKGVPLTESDPQWTTQSCAASHFVPHTGTHMSWYFGLQESFIVLWIRVLEPAGAPVHLGTKLALAIGTVRRLEHDEMDLQFDYAPNVIEADETSHAPAPPPQEIGPRSKAVESLKGAGGGGSSSKLAGLSGLRTLAAPSPSSRPSSSSSTRSVIRQSEFASVFVREKVRVETADPKLMSLSSKLLSLKHTLERVEENLAAVLDNLKF